MVVHKCLVTSRGPTSTCDLCCAVVPRSLMYFHRVWHEDQEGRTTRLFEVGEVERTVDELLATIAQLKSVSEVRARKAFVAELRNALVAEALHEAINRLEEASSPGTGDQRDR